MILFGGYDGAQRNDTWLLSLAPDAAWSKWELGVQLPPGRSEPSLVYDSLRDRLILFGGTDSSVLFGDVWALSLPDGGGWQQLVPSNTAPASRYAHTAIYDPARDQMIVFGGRAGSTYFADTWALSLETLSWTQIASGGGGPSGRFGHAAILDAPRDRVIVFGGFDGAAHRNDVWSLPLSGTPQWSQLMPSGTPPPGRLEHTAIFDPDADAMIAFGGTSDQSPNYRDDVWALNLSATPSWNQLVPSGVKPTGRRWHTAAYDPAGSRMIVHGGGDVPGSDSEEAWAFSLDGSSAWSKLSPEFPPPFRREHHTAVYEASGERMIVFGGYWWPSSILYNDVWALGLDSDPEWVRLLPSGTLPSPRSMHSAIYDSSRDRMIIFGGALGDFPDVLNDTWSVSLGAAPAWSAVSTTGNAPAPRWGHSAIYDSLRDRMIIFGGLFADDISETWFDDVWALSFANNTWTELTPLASAGPSGRRAHTAVYDAERDQMIVFGGITSSVSTPRIVGLSRCPAPPSGESFPRRAPRTRVPTTALSSTRRAIECSCSAAGLGRDQTRHRRFRSMATRPGRNCCPWARGL